MIDPPVGVVRFGGEPAIFFMAICRECGHALPFGIVGQRDEWIYTHVTATNHTVSVAVDVRPAPNSTVQMGGCQPIQLPKGE